MTFEELYKQSTKELCDSELEFQILSQDAKNHIIVVGLEYWLTDLEATAKRTKDEYKLNNTKTQIEFIKAILDSNIIYGGSETLGSIEQNQNKKE